MLLTRRRRSRKACRPCHQRKRKCDGELPCTTCTTYEYNCSYAAADNEGKSRNRASGGRASANSRRTSRDGRDRVAWRPGASSWSSGGTPQMERSSAGEATGSPTESPTLAARAAAAPAAVFDQHKSRYAGASAAMAFPYVLRGSLGADSPSKMQSLAYNFGIRPEEAPSTHSFLGALISEADLGFFSRVYLSALAPIGDLLDPAIYAQRCRHYYHGSAGSMVAFGAVAAGVAALGSFLSPGRHPREPDLVRYAKGILDDPASMRMLGIDHIVAWGLRVFYLRATSSPNNAWIASCTAMHLCEAVGLHEEDNVRKLASAAAAALVGHDADRLRRIFWISWAGHIILSYEYDRSAVRFRAVTCEAVTPTPGSVADQFVQIAQIIPAPNSPFRLECPPPTSRDELSERIKALEKLQFAHPFLVVTKAEIMFCFYRRIYQLKKGISDHIIKTVVDSGYAAVDAAQQLASRGHLLWNVIGSVFQYICVLLAIDKPAASCYIPAAFKGLENLVQAADTGVTRDALSMARHLLSLYTAKKRKELAQLEAVDADREISQGQADSEENTPPPDMGLAIDWEQFLIEPYLSMLGPDVELQ